MAATVDRRRLAGPGAATSPIVYASALHPATDASTPKRTRAAGDARKIFLQTNLTPSVPSSAYLEVTPSQPSTRTSTLDRSRSATPKLAVNLLGPHSLPRTAPFSPILTLTTYLKLSPFALSKRAAHIRSPTERDLSAHLETALRGAVIAERYPKTAVEIAVTVLEAEDGDVGLLNVLAGAITAGGAALVEAGIECVDIVAGGVAALVDSQQSGGVAEVVVDPAPSEMGHARATCCVGYLASRDELVEVWLRGDAGDMTDALVDGAVNAALAGRSVAAEVLREGVEKAAKS